VTAERSILSLRYTPVAARGGVRRAVGAFLRYIHYRDQEVDKDPEPVDRMLRYVAHRDRSSTKGRLFDSQRVIGDAERRSLTAYVVKSTSGLKAPADPKRQHRAVHRMVLSPEHADGLDLRQLTRAMMAQLEADAGELPPWIAAEHHNTKHPHVHIVLAARREVAPGRFRALLITRPRLARMKQAMLLEIARQRGERPRLLAADRPGWRRSTGKRSAGRLSTLAIAMTSRTARRASASFFYRVQRLARQYQRQLERQLQVERQRLEWVNEW
jgi:hypothetical protein